MCGRLKIALRQLCTKGNPDNRIFGSLAKKGVCSVGVALGWFRSIGEFMQVDQGLKIDTKTAVS